MITVPENIIVVLKSNRFKLEPLSKSKMIALRRKFPNLSEQFFKLTETVGYINTEHWSVTHEPYPLLHGKNCPIPMDFEGYKKELMVRNSGRPIVPMFKPEDMLVISPSGSSWDYCLRNNNTDVVYTIDWVSLEITSNNKNFFDFLFEFLTAYIDKH
jgi:virulence-associated protein VagC